MFAGGTTPPPLDYPTLGLLDLGGDAGLQLVDRPDVSIGTRPALLHPEIDAFVVQPLEPYSGALPSYPAFSASVLADPEKLDYTADQALIDRLKVSLSGVDVLSEAIQEAIYQSQLRDVAREQMKAVSAAMAQSAARGFSMPTGAVNAAVADVAHATRTRRNEASHKTRDETFQRAFDTLVEATAQSIAHEAKRFEIHMAYVKKLLEALEFNVRLAVELFDTAVGLFNTKVDLLKSVARDYRAYVGAVEAQDAAVVAGVKVGLEKVRSYQAEVEMHGAQVGTASVIADIESADVRQQVLKLAEYEAYLTGAMANVGIVKSNMESFRTAIGAFAKSLENEVQATEAYTAQVQAAGSIPGVWEANINAYAGFWRAEGDRVGAYSTYVQESGRKLDAQASEYRDYVGAHRSYLQAEIARIREEVSVINSYGKLARGGTGFASAYNRAQAAKAEARNMVALATASDEMMGDALQSADDAFNARVKANELATNATVSAGLSAAAWSVLNAGVRVGARASVGENSTKSGRTSYSASASRSWRKSDSWGSDE
jgi:hypothetical protein